VAQALRRRDIEVFLPLQKRLDKQRSRGLTESPLFPGYLFAQFDPRAMLPVVVCPGVVHVLCRRNTPEPVDPTEMHALLTVVRSELSLSPLPVFTTGEKVIFSRGPLANLEAIVVKDNSRSRVIVSISLLQRSVFAEVDREWLHGAGANGTCQATSWLPVAV